MIELILIASLSPLSPISAPVASVQPCVWPNTCASQPAVIASVQPCVWPNTCASKREADAEAVAAFQPCGIPNKCRQAEVAAALGDLHT